MGPGRFTTHIRVRTVCVCSDIFVLLFFSQSKVRILNSKIKIKKVRTGASCRKMAGDITMHSEWLGNSMARIFKWKC